MTGKQSSPASDEKVIGASHKRVLANGFLCWYIGLAPSKNGPADKEKTMTGIEPNERGAIAPDLLAILCCPETKEALTPLSAEQLAQLNEQIHNGRVKNKRGQPVTEPVDGGLIRQDQRIVYAIRDQIPIMLIEEGIVMHSSNS